jgi:hypothetical protein
MLEVRRASARRARYAQGNLRSAALKTSASFVGLGVVLGAVIGAVTGNVGMWIAMGIIFGAALAAIKRTR